MLGKCWIFEHRIRQQIEADDMQFGFVKGKGTNDAIFTVRQVQKNFRVTGKKLYFGFVALEKPFEVPRDRCPVLSVCHVTLVYCGQTVVRIKMKLGTHVGLGPGHSVLDGDPSPPKRGTASNFRPMSVVAKRLDGLRCHLVWR